MRRCLRMLADAEAWHADDMRYLDHAATTPLRSAAREAWLRASETVGNPSSVHSGGRAARTILDDARESVAASLGCDPAEVLFTSGGTEADNLAILGTMRAAPSGGLAVSAVEHPAVLEAAEAWGRDGGATQVLPVDARGAVDVRPLAPATALVSALKTSLPASTGDAASARKATVEAMSSVKADGLSGTIAFDRFGDPSNKTLTIYRLAGGNWVVEKTLVG